MSPDDHSPEDPLPSLIAELDQMIATMPHITRVAASWFGSFQEQGFTDRQALYLTAAEILQNPGTAP